MELRGALVFPVCFLNLFSKLYVGDVVGFGGAKGFSGMFSLRNLCFKFYLGYVVGWGGAGGAGEEKMAIC